MSIYVDGESGDGMCICFYLCLWSFGFSVHGSLVHTVYSRGFYFLFSAAEFLVEEWMEPRAFTELYAHTLYTPPFMYAELSGMFITVGQR